MNSFKQENNFEQGDSKKRKMNYQNEKNIEYYNLIQEIGELNNSNNSIINNGTQNNNSNNFIKGNPDEEEKFKNKQKKLNFQNKKYNDNDLQKQSINIF